MIQTATEMMFWLLVAHAVCDYPLQGDFLAKAKDHHAPLPGVPWLIALVAHSAIHAGGVALATGKVSLGFMEFVAHVLIDFGKCDRWYGFKTDQALHALCKVAWLLLALS